MKAPIAILSAGWNRLRHQTGLHNTSTTFQGTMKLALPEPAELRPHGVRRTGRPYRSRPAVACAIATLAGAWVAATNAVYAQSLGPAFQGGYGVRDLGAPPGASDFGGCIRFKMGDDSTLLVDGYLPDGEDSEVFAVRVKRDATGHIAGFEGSATWLLHAPGNPSLSIDVSGLYSGLDYGPNGALLYPTWDASIAQIRPGGTGPTRFDRTADLGIDGRVKGLAFVPPGFPGAGRLKLTAYRWLDTSVLPDGAGTFAIATPARSSDVTSAEGFVYAKAGLPGFAKPGVLIAFNGDSVVKAYDIDANGDPVVGTERLFLGDFSYPRGATVDPLTGDFLFSSSVVGSSRVLVVGSLAAPPPEVTLTSPADGARFVAPANVSLWAVAKQEGGAIARVEFLMGSTLIATRIPPALNEVPVELTAGEFSFRAIAYDAGGQSATSKVVHVSVVNEGPVVTLLYPTNDTMRGACSDLTFTAKLRRGNSPIDTFKLWEGEHLLMHRPVDQDAATTFVSLRHVAEGTHSYRFEAIDLNGLIATAMVTNVIVEPLPFRKLSIHHYSHDSLLFCYRSNEGDRCVWESSPGVISPSWAPFLTNTAPAGLWQLAQPFSSAKPAEYYRVRQVP